MIMETVAMINRDWHNTIDSAAGGLKRFPLFASRFTRTASAVDIALLGTRSIVMCYDCKYKGSVPSSPSALRHIVGHLSTAE